MKRDENMPETLFVRYNLNMEQCFLDSLYTFTVIVRRVHLKMTSHIFKSHFKLLCRMYSLKNGLPLCH
jgi:hypothetical protein